MTAPRTAVHDPDDTWIYGWEWSGVLAAVNGTISGHQVLVPAGLTLVDSGVDGTRVTAIISGGEVGQAYDVVCRVTVSADGQTLRRDATRTLIVRQR